MSDIPNSGPAGPGVPSPQPGHNQPGHGQPGAYPPPGAQPPPGAYQSPAAQPMPAAFSDPSTSSGPAPGAPGSPTPEKKRMIPLPVMIVVGFVVALGLASVYVPGFGGSGEPLETTEENGVVEVPDQPSEDDQAAGGTSGATALVQVTSPQAGSTVAVGDSVVVGAVLASGTIQTLDVYVDGALVASTNSAGPVSFVATAGTEQFTVLAILEDGTKASSAAVPITVVQAPSEQPADTPLVVTDVDRAVAIFQQFEDAAAIGDWDRLRVLEPEKAAFTDQRWSEGYEMLEQAWVVPVRTLATDGSKRTERIGLVTNEVDLGTGSNVSKLFCVTWSVDLVAETMEQTGTNTLLFEPLEGYVLHTDYVEFLQATC